MTQQSEASKGKPYFLTLRRVELMFALPEVGGVGWIVGRRSSDHLNVSHDLCIGHSDESEHVGVPINCSCFRMKPPVARRWMFVVIIKNPGCSLDVSLVQKNTASGNNRVLSIRGIIVAYVSPGDNSPARSSQIPRSPSSPAITIICVAPEQTCVTRRATDLSVTMRARYHLLHVRRPMKTKPPETL